MYKDYDVNGVVYTDGNECVWYELKNKSFKKVAHRTIFLRSQFSNGGQSANRLARNRDIQRDQFIQLLAEKTVEVFYDKTDSREKVLNMLFCGPAEFKVEVSEHKLITSFFSSIHLVNMGRMDNDLIVEMSNKIQNPDDIENVNRIRYMIETADDKLVFGEDISLMIELCQLEILYIHKDLELKERPVYKLKIVKISSDMINQYDGMIGVKFY